MPRGVPGVPWPCLGLALASRTSRTSEGPGSRDVLVSAWYSGHKCDHFLVVGGFGFEDSAKAVHSLFQRHRWFWKRLCKSFCGVPPLCLFSMRFAAVLFHPVLLPLGSGRQFVIESTQGVYWLRRMESQIVHSVPFPAGGPCCVSLASFPF